MPIRFKYIVRFAKTQNGRRHSGRQNVWKALIEQQILVGARP